MRRMQNCREFVRYQDCEFICQIRKEKAKNGGFLAMKHVKLLAVMIVLCTIILTGCARTSDLVGTWRDSSGYTVEFREDGSYWESTYGASMRYTYDNDGLLYY